MQQPQQPQHPLDLEEQKSVKDKRLGKHAKKRFKKLQREEFKVSSSNDHVLSAVSSPNLLMMPEWNQENPERFSEISQLASASGFQSCSSQWIKKRCATECSQWTLHIHKLDSLAGKPPALIKLFDMPQPVAYRELKVFEHAVNLRSDLISEVMVREEFGLVLNERTSEIEEDLRRQAALSSNRESYNETYPTLREAISSIDVAAISLDSPITHLLTSSADVASLKEEHVQRCGAESVINLVFKIGQDPQDSLAALRRVDFAQYNCGFVFNLNGLVHGKVLGCGPNFAMRVSGEDIVKAIMERVALIRHKMGKVGSSFKTIESLTLTAPIKNSKGARFALQFHIPNLRQIRGQVQSAKQFLKIGVQVTKLMLQVNFNFEKSVTPKQQTESPLVQAYESMLAQRSQAKLELRKKRTFLLSGMAFNNNSTYQQTQQSRPRLTPRKYHDLQRQVPSPNYSSGSGSQNSQGKQNGLQKTTKTGMSTSSPSFQINHAAGYPRVVQSQHSMLLSMSQLQCPFLDPHSEQQSNPGNMERFLRVSTPMIVSSFRKKQQSQPSIVQLFQGITEAAAKGLRFEFSEFDTATQSHTEEVLVYTPVLSLLKLRFKKQARLPRVQFETSRDSIFSQLTASAIIRAKLPSETLSQLESAEATLDQVDLSRSYFALRWQYQMSLTSKISARGVHRHPNFLVYYSFGVDQNDKIGSWSRQLQLIGMQASSFAGLQRWVTDIGKPREGMVLPGGDRDRYLDLNQRLKELVQVTMDRETYKYLMKKQFEGICSDKRRESSSMNADGVKIVDFKEKCCHREFYTMQTEFSED